MQSQEFFHWVGCCLKTVQIKQIAVSNSFWYHFTNYSTNMWLLFQHCIHGPTLAVKKIYRPILTTNLAECVCVCAKCDPFLPLRFHFFFKLPEFFFRIAKFPYAAFGPLFAFHCPIFFTKNNTLNGVCMLNVTAAH